MTKLRTLVGVFVRASTTRGRLAGLAAFAAAAIVLALVVRSAPDASADTPGDLINALGLALIVPVGSLLVATATLGQLRSDGTLVYVWLRPVSRGLIALAAWLAAVIVTVPTVALPLTIAAVASGGGADLAIGTAISATAGVLAYCGVFVLLGLLTRFAAVWGLVYILIWEGLLAALGSGINNLALRNYTRSILDRVGDVELENANVTPIVAIVVLLAVAAVSVVLTGQRLRRIDVE